MSDQVPTFDVFALVELFSHQRIAGKVSEQVIAGSGFVRVDVPQTSRKPPYTRFFSPQAVYGITPVDEATMMSLAESIYAPDVIPLMAGRRLTDEGDDYDA
jgi:hypothetical protein